MKKFIVTIVALSMIVAVPAFAQHGQQGGKTIAASQSGAIAGANNSNYFEGSRIPPSLVEGPQLLSTQIQQNNAPTGRDKHFNRTIKPWAIKKCWSLSDLNRIENQFGFGNSIVKGKGNVQIIPFEEMKGSVEVFTVIDPIKYEDAIKAYTVIAAGVVFASDSENTYMQQWVKVMKANLKEIGTAYVMIFDEGGKEGSEAFGWNFGISVGASLAGVNGAGDRTSGIGATIGAGVANSQTVAQEYPHLTFIMLDKKAPAKK